MSLRDTSCRVAKAVSRQRWKSSSVSNLQRKQRFCHLILALALGIGLCGLDSADQNIGLFLQIRTGFLRRVPVLKMDNRFLQATDYVAKLCYNKHDLKKAER